jgi:hypothetical protein
MRRALKRGLAFGAVTLASLTLTNEGTSTLLAQSNMLVIASGLDNPRGLTFGPDGALYVAEAGRGGTSTLCDVGGNGQPRCYGPTGAITRITGIGVHDRVVTGLPSVAQASGTDAQGPNDIEFGFGSAWVILGYGANPLNRSVFEAAGIRFGSLVRVTGFGQWSYAVDVSDHELSNPDGLALDTNPFTLRILSDRAIVTDAGANALLQIGQFGHTTTLATFPRRDVGPVTIDSVPTTVAVGPDGAYYVGELTGAPFLVGAARIYRVPANGGTPTVVVDGFTTIIDLAFDLPRNAAYVLEHDIDGIIPTSGPGLDGRLVRINTQTGARNVVASTGLVKPGGLAVGADGAVYVTRRTGLAGLGDVVRIEIP